MARHFDTSTFQYKTLGPVLTPWYPFESSKRVKTHNHRQSIRPHHLYNTPFQRRTKRYIVHLPTLGFKIYDAIHYPELFAQHGKSRRGKGVFFLISEGTVFPSTCHLFPIYLRKRCVISYPPPDPGPPLDMEWKKMETPQ